MGGSKVVPHSINFSSLSQTLSFFQLLDDKSFWWHTRTGTTCDIRLVRRSYSYSWVCICVCGEKSESENTWRQQKSRWRVSGLFHTHLSRYALLQMLQCTMLQMYKWQTAPISLLSSVGVRERTKSIDYFSSFVFQVLTSLAYLKEKSIDAPLT